MITKTAIQLQNYLKTITSMKVKRHKPLIIKQNQAQAHTQRKRVREHTSRPTQTGSSFFATCLSVEWSLLE
jgi:hypothetical protein